MYTSCMLYHFSIIVLFEDIYCDFYKIYGDILLVPFSNIRLCASTSSPEAQPGNGNPGIGYGYIKCIFSPYENFSFMFACSSMSGTREWVIVAGC